MEKYEDVKATIFARGTIPDGHFGKRASVGFALIGHTCVTVSDSGYFRSGLPDVQDHREALYLLRRRPEVRITQDCPSG